VTENEVIEQLDAEVSLAVLSLQVISMPSFVIFRAPVES
jgi:hypothetical protein